MSIYSLGTPYKRRRECFIFAHRFWNVSDTGSAMASSIAPLAALLLLVHGSVGIGLFQSPIDLVDEDAVWDIAPPLKYENYDSATNKFYVENTGHSAQVTLTNEKAVPELSGGLLGDTVYKLQQAHLHWGADASEGSEHDLNGQRFSMEAHLVHWNTSYASYEEAAAADYGLLVVGILVQGKEGASNFNKDFQVIVDGVPKILQAHTKIAAGSNLFKWLLPTLQPYGYFTYPGSLTTSPYSENVDWLVYKTPVIIQDTQIDEFRKLIGSEEEELKENWRSLQALDGRVVAYVPTEDDLDSLL